MTVSRALIDDLLNADLVRTWSLIVTLFGDFSNEGAVSLSGKEVNSLLGHIGIRPEATRVALHRLKKDGWITTTKRGREVVYSLSNEGAEQTAAVYEDVYREDVKYPDGWQLILLVNNDQVDSRPAGDGISLFKNVVLVPVSLMENYPNCMMIDFNKSEFPDWFADGVLPSKTVDLAKRLNILAEQFLNHPHTFGQLDSAAIRLLFLHQWRKMALKENTWAHMWLEEQGSVAKYQSHVMRILKLLPNSL